MKKRLKDLWNNKVCANWKKIEQALRKLQKDWQAAEERLTDLREKVTAILICTRLSKIGDAVTFAQRRVEDVREAWRTFKKWWEHFKLSIKKRVKDALSKAYQATAPKWLQAKVRNLKDWWQNTCMVEEKGVFKELVLDKIVPKLMSFLNAKSAIVRKMGLAAAWVGEKAKAIGEKLWEKSTDFIAKWGPEVYGLLKSAASKGANLAERGLDAAKYVLCDVPGSLKERIEAVVYWAKQKWQAVKDVVSDQAERVRKWTEWKLSIIKKYGQEGWDFIRRHKEKASKLLSQYGKPVVDAFKKFGDAVITNTKELVDKAKQAVAATVERVRETVDRVKEEVKETVREVKEVVKKVFNAAGYAGCLIKACGSSPRQCYNQGGSDFDQDVARCDDSYGYDSSVAFSKARFLSCAAGWAWKGLKPFSGVGLSEVPSKIRDNCQ